VTSEAKDHEYVIRFLSLYAKLREMCDDDPAHVEVLARGDDGFRKICLDLSWVESSLSIAERSQRSLYAAPVDPKFVSAWRDFEERFSSVVAGIFLEELGMVLDNPAGVLPDRSEATLDHAEDAARERAHAIQSVIDFAESSIAGEYHGYDDEFVEQIELGLLEWKKLHFTLGLNLRSALTRRNLVPFVLIPRHVASKHGPAQALSLFEHLRQAHEAFVFGAPLAALALVRSVLELVLRNHYRTQGDLEEQIKTVKGLPRGVTRSDLHDIRRLANAVLHFSTERVSIPEDIERQIVKHLDVLRRLIEGAPLMPPAPIHVIKR
jgi:hypothetical protein